MQLKSAIFSIAAVAAAVTATGGDAPMARPPKALVVMVDGLRADAVVNCEMPRLRALMAGEWQPGYGCDWSLSASTIRDAMTESAPNHVSIATGLTAARHGIGSNADLLHGRHTYGGVAGKPATTWLSRLAAARQGVRPLFVCSWYGDLSLSPDYRVPILYDRDAANAGRLAEILSGPDAPDATMWFIDAPDHAGHGHGFLPYSSEYRAAVANADRWIGRALDAIAARPAFADEDWLVLVTADHGGWRRYHGQMNAQAYTIPFIVATRSHGDAREIAGIPRTCDAAPTALAHFGLDIAAMGLDGRDALGAKDAEEREARENSAPCSFALWVRADSSRPAVIAPRGAMPDGTGLALVAGWRNDLAKTSGCTDEERRTGAPGVALRVLRPDGGETAIGTFDNPPDEWVFYAATRAGDGTAVLYQGNPDGNLYFIAEETGRDAPTARPQLGGRFVETPLPGDGDASVRDFAAWPRTLSREEVIDIFHKQASVSR
ncbi:MAG: alkaline phosphatase family protein [Kiritimatiellae bacterium]|nr:alkaline phosphatase family protein [Kiritimatiellia bacterium]